MAEPSIFRDSAGNIRELNNQRLLADSTSFKSGLGSAAAVAVTVAAVSGYHQVVDSARLVIASIASTTTVLATITDGTTSWPAGAFSANGVYDIVAEGIDKISIKGASGGAMSLTAGTPGTGGSVVAQIKCHKVLAADV
jgi:hypothetical protein